MPDRAAVEAKADLLVAEVRRLMRPQRLIIIAVALVTFLTSSLAIGSVLQASSNCHYAANNRAVIRSVLELAKAMSGPRGQQFFADAERRAPPVDCGTGVIARQVGLGAAWAALVVALLAFVVLVGFPCGRRQLRRIWARLRRSGNASSA